MKKSIYFLLLLLNSTLIFGQCFPDRHSTTWFDGWLSCETKVNPNTLRGDSHWISYDFGVPYLLNELKIWNVIDPDLLLDGAEKVMIDYSLDGEKWTEFGEVTFPKASGIPTYEGDLVANLAGIKARFLLFTVISNYGGECTGFAEMRVAADSTTVENEDICIIADVYPNPFANEFTVLLEKKCLGEVYMALEDVTGRTVIDEQVIKVNEPKLINAQFLQSGVYFVCIRNGEIKERIKVVKN
jgi:hypothetical protein